jgi:hypothetical protein
MTGKRRILAFRPKHNSHRKKDVTGAFKPESRNLLRCMGAEGSEVVVIDNHLDFEQRRARVLEAFDARDDDPHAYDAVAFLCHGWIDGIQLGFKRAHVDELAQRIWELTDLPTVRVPLYCCSTGDDPEDDPLTAVGSGDESFADKLRDALCLQGAYGCRVVGHTTVAHTTRNPHVIFFDGWGSLTGGNGGYAPVLPGRNSWLWRGWKAELWRRGSTLRFRMPWMTDEAIHQELAARYGP